MGNCVSVFLRRSMSHQRSLNRFGHKHVCPSTSAASRAACCAPCCPRIATMVQPCERLAIASETCKRFPNLHPAPEQALMTAFGIGTSTRALCFVCGRLFYRIRRRRSVLTLWLLKLSYAPARSLPGRGAIRRAQQGPGQVCQIHRSRARLESTHGKWVSLKVYPSLCMQASLY